MKRACKKPSNFGEAIQWKLQIYLNALLMPNSIIGCQVIMLHKVLITQSFGEQDKEKLTAQLGKAQELLNVSKNISKNNPEILVMQALLHTAWVAYDGATYGMTLSPKVSALYAQAEQIAPNNPRVVLNKAEWAMGSARFFGQDTTPFCKDVEKALELFANFKLETAFHPKWGKNRAEQILESCK